jgi:hypothetical protein
MEARKTNRMLVAVGWSVLFALKECRPSRIARFRCLAKTRQLPSTQPSPETPQRLGGNLAHNPRRGLGELLAHNPSIRLGRDSKENLAAGFPSCWISISSRTSSSSAARWKPENQTGCLSPSDGASCWLFFAALGR